MTQAYAQPLPQLGRRPSATRSAPRVPEASLPKWLNGNRAIPRSVKRFLLTLAGFAFGDKTTCFPSNEKIAEAGGYSVGHVRRMIAKCEKTEVAPGVPALVRWPDSTNKTQRLFHLPWKGIPDPTVADRATIPLGARFGASPDAPALGARFDGNPQAEARAEDNNPSEEGRRRSIDRPSLPFARGETPVQASAAATAADPVDEKAREIHGRLYQGMEPSAAVRDWSQWEAKYRDVARQAARGELTESQLDEAIRHARRPNTNHRGKRFFAAVRDLAAGRTPKGMGKPIPPPAEAAPVPTPRPETPQPAARPAGPAVAAAAEEDPAAWEEAMRTLRQRIGRGTATPAPLPAADPAGPPALTPALAEAAGRAEPVDAAEIRRMSSARPDASPASTVEGLWGLDGVAAFLALLTPEGRRFLESLPEDRQAFSMMPHKRGFAPIIATEHARFLNRQVEPRGRPASRARPAADPHAGPPP